MAKPAFEVKGDKALIRKLAALGNAGPRVAKGSVFEVASKIEARAKDLVPVRNIGGGALRASGHSTVEAQGLEVVGKVGFGGPAAPYALAVHENPRAGKTGGVSPRGKPYRSWAEVGQWKYLETAFKELARTLVAVTKQRMAREVRRAAAS